MFLFSLLLLFSLLFLLLVWLCQPQTGFYEFQKKDIFEDTVEITIKRPYFGAIPIDTDDQEDGAFTSRSVQGNTIRRSFIAIILNSRPLPALPLNPGLYNVEPGNTQRQQTVIESVFGVVLFVFLFK